MASKRGSSSRVYTTRKTNNEPENDDFQDRNLLFQKRLHFQLQNVRLFRRKNYDLFGVFFVFKNVAHGVRSKPSPSRPHHLRLPIGFVESFWPSVAGQEV